MEKFEIIQAMENHGYWYDNIDSYDGWLVFRHELGSLSFESWNEVEEWVTYMVWD